MLTHGIPPEFRGGVHIFLPAPHTVGSVPSLSGHAIAYRSRSLPRVRWHRASSPQSTSSNGCCLCITMDQILLCSSLFPHPLLILYSENVQIIGCIQSIQVSKYLGLCIGAQHRYNLYRRSRYIGEISAAERSEAAEPKTAPRLVRGLAGGAAGAKKNHAIWLHFPSKSGNNIDYRIVE